MKLEALLDKRMLVPADDIRWMLWTGVTLAFYWWILANAYLFSVAPLNATDYSMYIRPNSIKQWEGFLWAFLMLPTIGMNWSRPSDFGLGILYFIGLVPTLLLFGIADQPRSAMYLILAGYFSVVLALRTPLRMPFVHTRQGGWISAIIAGLSVLLILGWYATKGDLTNMNVDLLQVYDFREESGQIFSGPIAYLAGWTPRVLLPFLFCYALLKKQWILFAIAISLQMFCLVMLQEKSVFIPCIILGLTYLAPDGQKGRIFFVLALIATIVACDILYQRYDFPIASQLWTRRFFFDQQFLYFNYIDIFSKIGFVYYSDSFLSGVVHYPFQYPPGYMVSYYTSGQVEGNSNTGYLGAGYMELGSFGVITSGLLAGLVLRLADRVSMRGVPMWFIGTTTFFAFDSMLLRQNFFTSLLTGGVAVLLLLMLLSKSRETAVERPSGAVPATA